MLNGLAGNSALWLARARSVWRLEVVLDLDERRPHRSLGPSIPDRVQQNPTRRSFHRAVRLRPQLPQPVELSYGGLACRAFSCAHGSANILFHHADFGTAQQHLSRGGILQFRAGGQVAVRSTLR